MFRLVIHACYFNLVRHVHEITNTYVGHVNKLECKDVYSGVNMMSSIYLQELSKI